MKTVYSPHFCIDDFVMMGPVIYMPAGFLQQIKGSVNSLRIVRTIGPSGEVVLNLELDLIDEPTVTIAAA